MSAGCQSFFATIDVPEIDVCVQLGQDRLSCNRRFYNWPAMYCKPVSSTVAGDNTNSLKL